MMDYSSINTNNINNATTNSNNYNTTNNYNYDNTHRLYSSIKSKIKNLRIYLTKPTGRKFLFLSSFLNTKQPTEVEAPLIEWKMEGEEGMEGVREEKSGRETIEQVQWLNTVRRVFVDRILK